MKRRTVSEAAVNKAGARSTKASAKLEGREVPEGHVHSEAVQRYLDKLAAQPSRPDSANQSREVSGPNDPAGIRCRTSGAYRDDPTPPGA